MAVQTSGCYDWSLYSTLLRDSIRLDDFSPLNPHLLDPAWGECQQFERGGELRLVSKHQVHRSQ